MSSVHLHREHQSEEAFPSRRPGWQLKFARCFIARFFLISQNHTKIYWLRPHVYLDLCKNLSAYLLIHMYIYIYIGVSVYLYICIAISIYLHICIHLSVCDVVWCDASGIQLLPESHPKTNDDFSSRARSRGSARKIIGDVQHLQSILKS